MNPDIEKIAGYLKNAEKVTILTGAGISAESGVPTFRGKEGLWKKYRPQDLATPQAFEIQPEVAWQWYGYRQELINKCQPNKAHYILWEFQNFFDRFSLITQNVDGLHEKAGSKEVIELHGNIFKARCMACNRIISYEYPGGSLPRCHDCGNLLRPAVVWFGESLNQKVLEQAFKKAMDCDVFLTIGTSALVQPAASLPLIAARGGAKTVEINPDSTPLSLVLDVSVRGNAAKVLDEVWKELKY
ncbi:MAG: SIR2 family NAD-dependent protein deacylase [Vulcanimicrobiota bacterium]